MTKQIKGMSIQDYQKMKSKESGIRNRTTIETSLQETLNATGLSERQIKDYLKAGYTHSEIKDARWID